MGFYTVNSDDIQTVKKYTHYIALNVIFGKFIGKYSVLFLHVV